MDYKLSLYKPAEIEINGQKYPFRKRNRSFYEKLKQLEQTEGSDKDKNVFIAIPIMYDRLKLYVDAPPEVIDELDESEVRELVDILGREINPSKDNKTDEKETEAKNGPKPGVENIPS